nr:MAG TPA: hypothetical protein [Inoviridae sp.]
MNRRNFLINSALMGTGSLLAANAFADSANKVKEAAADNDFLPNTGPGNKFDYDGQALRFKGNSLISHVPQDSEFYQYLLHFQDKIRHSEIADRHVFLPKNSLHVTIFNGTNETLTQRDKAGFWPADLPKDATIEAVHAHYLNKLKGFKPDLPKKLEFKPTELWTPFDKKGLTLGMELVHAEDKAKLIEFRRALNELLQTSRNVPEKLDFHISLGYTWKKYSAQLMESAEKKRVMWSQEFARHSPVLHIDQIEFAIFNDMLSYSPLHIFYLNK